MILKNIRTFTIAAFFCGNGIFAMQETPSATQAQKEQPEIKAIKHILSQKKINPENLSVIIQPLKVHKLFSLLIECLRLINNHDKDLLKSVLQLKLGPINLLGHLLLCPYEVFVALVDLGIISSMNEPGILVWDTNNDMTVMENLLKNLEMMHKRKDLKLVRVGNALIETKDDLFYATEMKKMLLHLLHREKCDVNVGNGLKNNFYRILTTLDPNLIFSALAHPQLNINKAEQAYLEYQKSIKEEDSLLFDLTSKTLQYIKQLKAEKITTTFEFFTPLHAMTLIGHKTLARRALQLNPHLLTVINDLGCTPIDDVVMIQISQATNPFIKKRYLETLEVLVENQPDFTITIETYPKVGKDSIEEVAQAWKAYKATKTTSPAPAAAACAQATAHPRTGLPSNQEQPQELAPAIGEISQHLSQKKINPGKLAEIIGTLQYENLFSELIQCLHTIHNHDKELLRTVVKVPTPQSPALLSDLLFCSYEVFAALVEFDIISSINEPGISMQVNSQDSTTIGCILGLRKSLTQNNDVFHLKEMEKMLLHLLHRPICDVNVGNGYYNNFYKILETSENEIILSALAHPRLNIDKAEQAFASCKKFQANRPPVEVMKSLEYIRQLRNEEVDISCTECTPLHSMAFIGHTTLVKRIFKLTDPRLHAELLAAQNYNGHTPIAMVIINGSLTTNPFVQQRYLETLEVLAEYQPDFTIIPEDFSIFAQEVAAFAQTWKTYKAQQATPLAPAACAQATTQHKHGLTAEQQAALTEKRAAEKETQRLINIAQAEQTAQEAREKREKKAQQAKEIQEAEEAQRQKDEARRIKTEQEAEAARLKAEAEKQAQEEARRKKEADKKQADLLKRQAANTARKEKEEQAPQPVAPAVTPAKTVSKATPAPVQTKKQPAPAAVKIILEKPLDAIATGLPEETKSLAERLREILPQTVITTQSAKTSYAAIARNRDGQKQLAVTKATNAPAEAATSSPEAQQAQKAQRLHRLRNEVAQLEDPTQQLALPTTVPLCIAAKYRQSTLITALLEAGEDPFNASYKDYNPLQSALENEDLDALEALLTPATTDLIQRPCFITTSRFEKPIVSNIPNPSSRTHQIYGSLVKTHQLQTKTFHELFYNMIQNKKNIDSEQVEQINRLKRLIANETRHDQ